MRAARPAPSSISTPSSSGSCSYSASAAGWIEIGTACSSASRPWPERWSACVCVSTVRTIRRRAVAASPAPARSRTADRRSRRRLLPRRRPDTPHNRGRRQRTAGTARTVTLSGFAAGEAKRGRRDRQRQRASRRDTGPREARRLGTGWHDVSAGRHRPTVRRRRPPAAQRHRSPGPRWRAGGRSRPCPSPTGPWRRAERTSIPSPSTSRRRGAGPGRNCGSSTRTSVDCSLLHERGRTTDGPRAGCASTSQQQAQLALRSTLQCVKTAVSQVCERYTWQRTKTAFSAPLHSCKRRKDLPDEDEDPLAVARAARHESRSGRGRLRRRRRRGRPAPARRPKAARRPPNR